MADLRGPDAGVPSSLVRRRSRSAAAVYHLLDSRLFRLLCMPGREAALEGFRTAASGPGGLPPLELTPMAFLDAIGIEPPRPDTFPLPAKVVKDGEALTVTTLVVRFIEAQFREAPDLQADRLQKRVEELREGVPPAALDLFDLCASGFVARAGFAEQIVKQLSFDYLYRFPFPESLREEVIDFLCASLFAAGETVSGLSKMRMIKVLWDRAYPRLLKSNPAARGEIQALDRELKPRSWKDYLAWEPVHHAVLGFTVAKERILPVTAFIPEPAETARARSILYKSALRAFLDQISPADLARLRPQLDAWAPGTLVPCAEDGARDEPVPTGGLPVFVAGAEART